MSGATGVFRRTHCKIHNEVVTLQYLVFFQSYSFVSLSSNRFCPMDTDLTKHTRDLHLLSTSRIAEPKTTCTKMIDDFFCRHTPAFGVCVENILDLPKQRNIRWLIMWHEFLPKGNVTTKTSIAYCGDYGNACTTFVQPLYNLFSRLYQLLQYREALGTTCTGCTTIRARGQSFSSYINKFHVHL